MKQGEAFLCKINGDFAFALYNSHTKETIAARDPVGIKALYYIVLDGKYHFSDTMDDFFDLKSFEKKPNIESMRSILHRGNVSYEETMYEGIKRIPPGHYMKIVGDSHTLHRYWFPENIDIDYTVSLKDASKKFLALFEKAVERRIDKYKETAFELSGGLDSSSVVSLLKTKYPHAHIDTYSMYFGDMYCDERPYIQSVEKKFDFTSKKVDVENLDYTHVFNLKFNYKKAPHWPITTTFTMYFPMLEEMKHDHKRIIITGQGGDHLLEGSCCTAIDLMERKKWMHAMVEFRYFPLGPLPFTKSCAVPRKIRNILKKMKKIFKSDLPINKENEYFARSSSCTQNNTLFKLISSAQSTMLDSNIFHAAEKHYNVEFRHPFFDKELIEYTLSLPPEFTYSRGWTKVLLRYALHGILPNKIISRNDKAEFSEVLVKQIEASDMMDALRSSKLVELGIAAQKDIDKQIVQYHLGQTKNLLDLWTVINVESWYRYHFSSNDK